MFTTSWRSLLGMPSVLVTLTAACAPLQAQSVRLPNTPAGRVLGVWLDAFNRGDTSAMNAYIQRYEPGNVLPLMIERRRRTGGFDLIGIERSEPHHLEFVVKTRVPDGQNSFGYLDVAGDDEPRVVDFPPLFTNLGVGGTTAKLVIDATQRRDAVMGAAAQLDSFYVFPEVAKRIGDSLRARLARGAYDHHTNGVMFAKTLNDDVREISHDRHMSVEYSPNPVPARPMAPPPPPTPAQRQQILAQLNAQNCGFQKIERLDGNIGYLKFNFFPDPEYCGGTASAAMTLVAATNALIVDLRDNGGGTPAMVAYLSSYLFDDSTHLNDLWVRPTGTTTQWWTTPSVPGIKFGRNKLVFVLTSSRTFSGAEEFSYDLQVLKRATIVGETTGGGAHPVTGRRASEHLMIGVPAARAINPWTHTNWEGVGVEPDVKISASDALSKAVQLALARLGGGPPPR